MTERDRWKVIGYVLAIVLCSPIGVFGLNTLQFVAAPEWLRYPLMGVFLAGMLTLFGWFFLLFYLPIRFLREAFGDRQRHRLLATLAATLFVYGSFPLGYGIYRHQRDKALARVSERAQPIVNALEVFKTKTGGYPADLSALVPDYLPAIPRTGTAIFSEFHYLRATDKTLFRSYELSVPTPQAFNSFDRYLFWPEGKYPEYYGRNALEPIGDWVFMHE